MLNIYKNGNRKRNNTVLASREHNTKRGNYMLCILCALCEE